MKLPTRRPRFDEIDGEYVIPVRFSENLAHHLIAGWWPIGFGWANLRPREDGSFDLFTKEATLSEDMNLVKLDAVRDALTAALDLAYDIKEEESLGEKIQRDAREVVRLVRRTTREED